MANQFVTLPAPAGNGSGVAVDVSTFGGLKTVTNAGNGFTFEPTVTIEFSNQLVPTNFAPLWTFGKPDEKSLTVAARWMRATVSNYKGGGGPVINVGGNDDGTQFAELIAPAGDGPGAGVDVSGLDAFKTIHVAQAFRGALNIEISEDGGATYSTIATFYGPGHKSQTVAADFMRVRRGGVPANSPGLPVINIGATDEGAGASGVKVEDEGVPIGPNQFSTLNFIGGGVVASDAGAGVADIVIPGITFEDEGTPIAGAPHDTVNFTGTGVAATDMGGGVVMVNVPGAGTQAIDVEDEGVLLGAFGTLNFTGGGVTATDAGAGISKVDVPGITFEDEGVPLAGAPHTIVNFVGPGITATDAGAGVVEVAVPLVPGNSSAVLVWGAERIASASDNRLLSPGTESGVAPIAVGPTPPVVGVSIYIDLFGIPMPRAGLLKDLYVRHNSNDGNGNPVVYYILVNRKPTALFKALATGAIGQASNLVNSVVVAAGDFVSVLAYKALNIAGGDVNVQVSVEFV